jgi:hypothetical protein
MAERMPEPSGPGSVVLDIGGDVGAAVVVMSAKRNGTEIEIAPEGRDWDGTHTMVRPRHLHAGVVHAGVFGALREGNYRVRLRLARPVAESVESRFEVRGGQVTYTELSC